MTTYTMSLLGKLRQAKCAQSQRDSQRHPDGCSLPGIVPLDRPCPRRYGNRMTILIVSEALVSGRG